MTTPINPFNLLPDSLLARVVPVTAAITLTAAQSGSVISAVSAGVSYVITLPAVAASTGVNYKILLSSSATTNTVTVRTSASEAHANGIVMGNVTKVAAVNFHDLIFGTTALAGDYAEYFCDGSIWAVRAWSQVSSLTIA